MKKLILSVVVLFSTSLPFAGGKTGTTSGKNLSAVSAISGKTCKVNRIYDELDVKLMWQDQPYTDSEDSAFNRNRSLGKAGNWNYSINYCRKLNYAGYNDWRLPTSTELIHVHKKAGQVFAYFRGSEFWSSSAAEDARQYVVFPTDAYQYKRAKKESYYIRCVRCTAK